MYDKIKQFLIEVFQELKKVTWPGKKETISSTVVVFILIGIMALFVAFADFILSVVLRRVIGM